VVVVVLAGAVVWAAFAGAGREYGGRGAAGLAAGCGWGWLGAAGAGVGWRRARGM
jgi:hypothetical protein